MTVGAAAYLEIQWIDMVFNTSGPAMGYEERRRRRNLEPRSNGCGTVCAVDGIQRPGFPEIVFKAPSAADSVANSLVYLVWGVPLLVAVLGVQAGF